MLKLFIKVVFSLLFLSVVLWFGVVQPVLPSEKIEIPKQASEIRLRKYVEALSIEMPPRSHDVDKLNVTADYIKKEFSSISTARVSEQVFDVWGIKYRNIIASFGKESGEQFVIGAHYDSHDGLPGADDNASGVAGILELARLLEGDELPYKVNLVAFALEEMPSFRTKDMGSANYSKMLRDADVNVRLMISLEMIGYFDERSGSQKYPFPFLEWLYPDSGDYIAVVGNLGQMQEVRRVKKILRGAQSVPVESINAPTVMPGIDFSDHLGFWWQGYPAVMLTDTAEYRNSAYHTSNDLPARLDFKKMAEVVNGVYAVVKHY